MFRRILLALVILGVVVAGAVGFAYLKPTAGASEPIAAIPLATVGPAATAETAELTGATEATAEQEPEVTEAAVMEAAGTEPQTEPQAASAASTPASTPIVFEIIPAESQARFIINEVLNGAPTTVVGATDQVAGQIAIDPAAPLNTQVGVIQINARTLATDNAMRNRAIGNRILSTDQYEYITFTPTAVAGLPETVAVGEAIQFQVTGDLTVRDVTQPVTFTAEATPVSDTRLEGAARATIRYADFGLAIPQVPSVASVDEEVVLEIEFAAEPV